MASNKSLSKNTKILIFSGIGILVLGLVTLVLMLTAPKEEVEEEVTSEVDETLIFSAKTADDIESVKITNKDSEYVIKAYENDETDLKFTIDGLQNAPLVSATFNSNMNNAAKLTVKKLVEENAAGLEKYGLQNPVSTAVITFRDGEKLELELGNEAPTDSSTYIKKRDSNDVYIASTSSVKYINASKYTYVDTALMEEYDGELLETIEYVRISQKDKEEIYIEAVPEELLESITAIASHEVKSPIEVFVDSTAGQDAIYGMFGLTASEALWVGLDEQDYEISGLNDPFLTVEMSVEGRKYKLQIGNPVTRTQLNSDGEEYEATIGYYGVFDKYPDVLYLFPESSLPWIDMETEDIMTKLFMIPYIYNLDEFIIETVNDKITVKVDGDATECTFYYDGAETDADKAKLLYQFMIGAYAENIFTEDTDSPFVARYTYKYKDKNIPDDVVEFYDSKSDNKTIIKVNGNFNFKCRHMYLERLLQNVEAYKAGNEINISW